MTTVIRHGGEAHTMRPDRVMRTGVLSPMMGYQPQMDVQRVAYAFTQGPPLGTMLQGFGAAEPGFFEKIKLRIQLAIENSKLRKAMANNPGPPPAANVGSQVAPQQAAQMTLLAHLAPRSVHQRPLAAAMNTLARRRWFSYYRAG